MGLYPSLFSNFVIPFPQNHQIRMLLLGIDLGTSSVKVSVVDAQSQQCIASAFFPETEADIISPTSRLGRTKPRSMVGICKTGYS